MSPDYLIFDEIVSLQDGDRIADLFAIWQRERSTMALIPGSDVEICPTHNTPMVRERQHIGDGRFEWSIGYCPLCAEIAAKKEAQPVAAAKPAETQPAAGEEQ